MTSNSTSSLTGSALQASRAALSAALVEHDQSNQIRSEEELIEAGEIQEIDMQGQADAIRTVFSDPSNFNVKVRMSYLRSNFWVTLPCVCSILSILPGHSGSIHL